MASHLLFCNILRRRKGSGGDADRCSGRHAELLGAAAPLFARPAMETSLIVVLHVDRPQAGGPVVFGAKHLREAPVTIDTPEILLFTHTDENCFDQPGVDSFEYFSPLLSRQLNRLAGQVLKPELPLQPNPAQDVCLEARQPVIKTGDVVVETRRATCLRVCRLQEDGDNLELDRCERCDHVLIGIEVIPKRHLSPKVALLDRSCTHVIPLLLIRSSPERPGLRSLLLLGTCFTTKISYTQYFLSFLKQLVLF